MQISKKINNNDYYIIIDLEYKKDENNFPILCLKNYKDDYLEGGDFSILIEEVEKSYTSEKTKQYDKYIDFMTDVLYIDRIPFISNIKDTYISKNNKLPYTKDIFLKVK